MKWFHFEGPAHKGSHDRPSEGTPPWGKSRKVVNGRSTAAAPHAIGKASGNWRNTNAVLWNTWMPLRSRNLIDPLLPITSASVVGARRIGQGRWRSLRRR